MFHFYLCLLRQLRLTIQLQLPSLSRIAVVNEVARLELTLKPRVGSNVSCVYGNGAHETALNKHAATSLDFGSTTRRVAGTTSCSSTKKVRRCPSEQRSAESNEKPAVTLMLVAFSRSKIVSHRRKPEQSLPESLAFGESTRVLPPSKRFSSR